MLLYTDSSYFLKEKTLFSYIIRLFMIEFCCLKYMMKKRLKCMGAWVDVVLEC